MKGFSLPRRLRHALVVTVCLATLVLPATPAHAGSCGANWVMPTPQQCFFNYGGNPILVQGTAFPVDTEITVRAYLGNTLLVSCSNSNLTGPTSCQAVGGPFPIAIGTTLRCEVEARYMFDPLNGTGYACSG